jgi:hypothetical protein
VFSRTRRFQRIHASTRVGAGPSLLLAVPVTSRLSTRCRCVAPALSLARRADSAGCRIAYGRLSLRAVECGHVSRWRSAASVGRPRCIGVEGASARRGSVAAAVAALAQALRHRSRFATGVEDIYIWLDHVRGAESQLADYQNKNTLGMNDAWRQTRVPRLDHARWKVTDEGLGLSLRVVRQMGRLES